MKCNACYTDNVNEAKYCLRCGREITETYLDTSKRNNWILPVALVCVAVFAFAIATGMDKKQELFDTIQACGCFVDAGCDYTLVYNHKDKNTYSCSPNEGAISIQNGRLDIVEQNGGPCIICKSDTSLYAYSSILTELKDCNKYELDAIGENVGYLSNSGTLRLIGNNSNTEIDTDVLDFTTLPSCNGVAYVKTNDEDIKELYIYTSDNKKSALYTQDSTCESIISAGEKGICYSKAVGSGDPDIAKANLVFCNRNGNKFGIENYAETIAASNKSLMFSKSDGGTYLWDMESSKEIKITDVALTEMILPYGYSYSGSSFNQMIFNADTDGDSVNDAIYKIDSNNNAILIREDVKSCKIAKDCSFVYCLDNANKLYAIDTLGRYVTRFCGDNIKEYAVGADSLSVWILKSGGLYKFDGRKTLECALGSYDEIYLSAYDYIIIRGKNGSINVYKDNEMHEIVKSSKNIDIFASIGVYAYTDKKGDIYIAREDGSFLTQSQFEAQNSEKENASDSGSASTKKAAD